MLSLRLVEKKAPERVFRMDPVSVNGCSVG